MYYLMATIESWHGRVCILTGMVNVMDPKKVFIKTESRKKSDQHWSVSDKCVLERLVPNVW